MEILNEFFGRKKSVKKETFKPDSNYDVVVDKKDIEKYSKLYVDTVNKVSRLCKSAVPGAKICDLSLDPTITSKGDYDYYRFSTTIMDFKEHSKLYIKAAKIEDKDDWEDIDGNDIFDYMEEKIFNKLTEFEEAGSYTTHEYKKNPNLLSISVDDGMDDINVHMTFYVKKDEAVKESLFESIYESYL